MLYRVFFISIYILFMAAQFACGRKTVLQEVPYVPPPVSSDQAIGEPIFEPDSSNNTLPNNLPPTVVEELPALPTGEPSAGVVGEGKNQDVLLIEGYTKEQIRFRVQLGAFEKPKMEDDAFFTPISGQEVRVERASNGFYRYSMGWFDNLDKAEELKKELQTKGYKSAFIVAFGHDDKRINMDMKEVLRLYLGQ